MTSSGSFAVRVAAAVVALTLGGCAQPYVRQYEAGVARNFQNLQTIRLGMSTAEVEQLMGPADVHYKRVQLRNPWRSESYRVRPDLEVRVLFYVTQGFVWHSQDDRFALTPVVFENGKVVGWGWGFLERRGNEFHAAPVASR
jgi:hypothetical protein